MEHYLPMTEDTTFEVSPGPFTGRDVLYREKGVSALDVQRAADALLRRGQKPSIATVREQLGGGSPNTLAPLLEQYWKALGGRVAAGPDALERVPESLARMTEALWLRSIDEARQRAKASQAGTTPSERDHLALESKVTDLTAALAAARARTSELESQLLSSLQDGLDLRTQVRELTALIKAEQALRAHDQGEAGAQARELHELRRHLQVRARNRLARSRSARGAAAPGKVARPRARVDGRATSQSARAPKRRKAATSRRTRPARP